MKRIRRTGASRTVAARGVAALAAAALGLAVLAGCSSEGADTDCGLNACTVTFQRGVDANASVLGVEAKLVGVQDDVVTLEVAGEQVSLTTGADSTTEVAGLQVSLQSADDKTVVVEIRNPIGG